MTPMTRNMIHIGRGVTDMMGGSMDGRRSHS